MNFGIYFYLITVLIFPGLALLVYFCAFLLDRKKVKLNKTEWKSILMTIFLFTLYTSIGEKAALYLNLWKYYPEHTFNKIFFGAEVETYFFIILVALVVSIATLSYAKRQDK
jgi:hypothetical protein